MEDSLALLQLKEKFGIDVNCNREEVLDILEKKKQDYHIELVKCFTKKSGGYKSMNTSIHSRNSAISEIVDNERQRAEHEQELAAQMNMWKVKIAEVEGGLCVLGGSSRHLASASSEITEIGEDTRDCGDSAALMEGSELRINNKQSKSNFSIIRPVYTQHEFDQDHGGSINNKSFKKKCLTKLGNYKSKLCSPTGIKNFVLNRFPFIMIMVNYKWKEWIIADIIAGFIVGVMQIPQGMGYALIAGLDPQYGLYVSFFPAVVYFFFGTSRHDSMGTIAIISLLSGTFLSNSLAMFPINVQTVGNVTVGPSLAQLKASRAAGLTLCVGLIHLIMGVFRLGFITRYLSDPLVSGFTIGAAISVFTSQVGTCFGLSFPKQNGNFNIPMTYYQIFKNITSTNMVTLGLTLVCVAILIVMKQVVNPRLVKRIRVPIPIDLFLVIFGTVSSYYLSLNSLYHVSIVGTITKGLPAPVLPDIVYLSSSITDIFITAVIAFSISVSLAKIFAKKHNYSIDSNQECLAYGIMNVFSSFFLCYPAAASLSRSAVQDSIGGKTQITSILASGVVLIVILFVGPLFYYLPTCVLSAIIVVALKGMFMQFAELKELWLFSLWDFIVWVISFLITVIIDIPWGLLAGVGLSVLIVMFRTQSPRSHILGQITGTDLYKNVSVYAGCKEVNGIKIFRYEGSLYYASSEHFRSTLYKKVKCNPRILAVKISKLQKKVKAIEKRIKNNNEEVSEAVLEKRRMAQKKLEVAMDFNVHYVIIDCSTWGFIDTVGLKTLHQVIEEYKSINVTVLLANPKTDIREMFARSDSSQKLDDNIIYVSVHDAVITCLFDYKMKCENQESQL